MLVRLRLTGLWRHSNFVKLWIGSTISLLGSQVTFIALPFTAVLILHATPAQMGILAFANTVPTLLGGLFAGVWVDRMRRRPLLICMDIGRALLLGSIPIVTLLGILRIEYLYIIAFLVGICNLFFNIAYQAFLPTLIEREQLIEGNSKLQVSESTVEFAGPGLAGVLVQLLTAPITIIIDAFSYVASAISLLSLRIHEEKPVSNTTRQHFWHELIEGLRFTLGNPLLRIFAGTTGILNFTGGVFNALLVLYFVQDLHLGAAFYGLMYAIGSLSGIAGAFITGWCIRKVGIGRVAVISALFISTGWLFIPLVKGPTPIVVAFIFVGILLSGIGNTTYNITKPTLIQTITPKRLLGRVRSVATFIGLGTLPFGALIGGLLGSIIGSRSTLLAAGLIRFALLTIFITPLWKYSRTTTLQDLQITPRQEAQKEQ